MRTATSGTLHRAGFRAGARDCGSGGDRGNAAHVRVREDVPLVEARRGELAHDRARVTCLEPVKRVRRDRDLVARLEHDLVPHGQVLAAPGRRSRPRRLRRLAGDVDEIIAEFGATMALRKPGTPTGPAYDPTPGTPTYHEIVAVDTDEKQMDAAGTSVLAIRRAG